MMLIWQYPPWFRILASNIQMPNNFKFTKLLISIWGWNTSWRNRRVHVLLCLGAWWLVSCPVTQFDIYTNGGKHWGDNNSYNSPATRNTLTGSLTPHNCKYTPKTTSDITFAGPRPSLQHAPAQNSQKKYDRDQMHFPSICVWVRRPRNGVICCNFILKASKTEKLCAWSVLMVNSGGHQTSITSKQGENFQNFYLIKYSATRDKPALASQQQQASNKTKNYLSQRLLADFSGGWHWDPSSQLNILHLKLSDFHFYKLRIAVS